MELIKTELGISLDEAIAAKAGKPNRRNLHSKHVKIMKRREKMMSDLQQGFTRSLIDYQQAVGGTISWTGMRIGY